MAKYNATPDNFGSIMERIAEKSEKKVEKATEDFVFTTFKEVIDGTPVGKPELWQTPPPPNYVPGKLKSNWFPSIGSPSGETTESTSGSEDRLGSLRGRVAGQKAYLTNNQPYAYPIEIGAKQTYTPNAQGWVTRIADSSKARINKIAKKYLGE
jgi:hypothetical protein